VLALLLVQAETGSRLLAALAFTIGFIALTVAGSELFTENFLVPVAAVVAGRSSIRSLLRLWFGTLACNLVAGWLFTWLLIGAVPRVRATAVELGSHYVDLGLGWEAFALGILGGAVITIMTWMERNTESPGVKIVAAVTMPFVLAAVPLNHVIVSALEMFAALHAGAPFGYAQWLAAMLWALLANMAGGLLLVTVLRLVQVGRSDIVHEQEVGEREVAGGRGNQAEQEGQRPEKRSS